MTKQSKVTIELPIAGKYGFSVIQDFFNEVQKQFDLEKNIKNELYSFVSKMKLQEKYYEFSKIKRAIAVEPSVIEDRKELRRLVWLIGYRNEEIKKLDEKVDELRLRAIHWEHEFKRVEKEALKCRKEDYIHPDKMKFHGNLRIVV